MVSPQINERQGNVGMTKLEIFEIIQTKQRTFREWKSKLGKPERKVCNSQDGFEQAKREFEEQIVGS